MVLNEHFILNQNTDKTFTCIEKENNARLTFKSKKK